MYFLEQIASQRLLTISTETGVMSSIYLDEEWYSQVVGFLLNYVIATPDSIYYCLVKKPLRSKYKIFSLTTYFTLGNPNTTGEGG